MRQLGNDGNGGRGRRLAYRMEKTYSQRRSVARSLVDMSVVAAQAVDGGKFDGGGEEEGEEPGQDHNLVIACEVADEAAAAEDAGADEDGRERERGRGDGQHSWAAVRRRWRAGHGKGEGDYAAPAGVIATVEGTDWGERAAQMS